MDRLTRRDWLFIAVCVALFAASLTITIKWFSRAFPEASIDFRFDREASLPLAEHVLNGERINVNGLRHTAMFDDDDTAKIFLERTLGVDEARKVMARDVRL